MSLPDWLYRRRADGRYESSPLTDGPWRAGYQHGGPPSALLAGVLERTCPEWSVVRVVVELVAPVPVATLSVEVDDLARTSRRVASRSAQLSAGGTPVARARVVLLAPGDLPEPGWRPDEVAEVPGPQAAIAAPPWADGADRPAFHRSAVEHRFVMGEFGVPGPAVDWVRLIPAVIDGREPSGRERALAVADLGSGIGAVYPPDGSVGLINADLDVAFAREPRGEWIRLAATTRVGPHGTGMAVTELGDPDGVAAVGTQVLLGTAPPIPDGRVSRTGGDRGGTDGPAR